MSNEENVEKHISAETIFKALPIIHITLTFIYLFGYSEGFGDHIVNFMSTEDIVRAALRGLPQVYIPIIAIITVSLVQEPIFAKDNRLRKLFWVFLIYIIAAALLALTIFHNQNRSETLNRSVYWSKWWSLRSFEQWQIILLGLEFIGCALICNFMDHGQRKFQVISQCLIIYAVFFSLLLGMNKGTHDIYRSDADAKNDFPSCKMDLLESGREFILIRAIGDKYLAKDTANNKWFIVGKECKIFAEFFNENSEKSQN